MKKLDVMARVIQIILGIIAILTFMAGYLQSFITSDVIEVFDPWVWYVVAGIAFIIAILFAIIYTRKPPVGSGWSDATSDSSYHPYRLLPDKRHNDVLWEVYGSREVPVLNEIVKIKTPPKCFKCQVELKEESRRFIGGYKWWCIRCGFSKKNKDSFEEEADCVKRLVEGEYRRQRQGQPPQGRH